MWGQRQQRTVAVYGILPYRNYGAKPSSIQHQRQPDSQLQSLPSDQVVLTFLQV